MKAKLQNGFISVSVLAAGFVSALLITAYLQRESRFEFACSPFTEQKGSAVRHCVPNPFRDKTPEHTSNRLLNAIRDRHFDEVLPYLKALSKEPEKYIGKERELTISSWRIINREAEPDGRYHLAYLYSRGGEKEKIPIGFYFVKQNDEWVLNEILAAW